MVCFVLGWVVLGWVVLGWVVLGWVVLGWVVLGWVGGDGERLLLLFLAKCFYNNFFP